MTLRDKTASEKFVYDVVFRSEDRLEKRIDEFEAIMRKRFDKVMATLIDIAGQFKKFDEERVILAAHSKDHTDRVEKLEDAVFRPS